MRLKGESIKRIDSYAFFFQNTLIHLRFTVSHFMFWPEFIIMNQARNHLVLHLKWNLFLSNFNQCNKPFSAEMEPLLAGKKNS